MDTQQDYEILRNEIQENETESMKGGGGGGRGRADSAGPYRNTEQRQRHCWPASGTSPRAVAPHTAAEGSGPATGAQTPTSSAMAQAAKHLRKNKDLEIQLEQERKEKEEERNKKRSRSRDKKRKDKIEEGKACSSNSMDEAGIRFLARELMHPNFD
ncbi:hypothetical protein NQZ68_041585 [Dissostichus eleginoides]|nr:hypothetical protein NQZ68_041585 [Dissostichus eleginoides]